MDPDDETIWRPFHEKYPHRTYRKSLYAAVRAEIPGGEAALARVSMLHNRARGAVGHPPWSGADADHPAVRQYETQRRAVEEMVGEICRRYRLPPPDPV